MWRRMRIQRIAATTALSAIVAAMASASAFGQTDGPLQQVPPRLVVFEGFNKPG